MFDANKIETDLDNEGYSVVANLISNDDCDSIRNGYVNEAQFRNRVVMAQHNFGLGEYKYFDYPLPGAIAHLRTTCYEALYPIANRWNAAMKLEGDYPSGHCEYLDRCRRAGQAKATPLILKYGKDDYNCLHQDLYGDHVFPIQLAVLLSNPGEDFEGGELILTEQRPRMQSRPIVVPLGKGDGVIFPVRYRPKRGTRSTYRVNVRHGVSRLIRGERYVLGVIFHDAT